MSAGATYTVVQNGVATEHEMSPEMQAIAKQAAEFDAAHPDFWCHCGDPETGRIIPRGHSVDVTCRHCDGYIQIG